MFKLECQINGETTVSHGKSIAKLVRRAQIEIENRGIGIFRPNQPRLKTFMLTGYKNGEQIFMYGTPANGFGVWSYNESENLRNWARRVAWFYLGEHWL